MEQEREEVKPLVDPQVFLTVTQVQMKEDPRLDNQEREHLAAFLKSTTGVKVVKCLRTVAFNHHLMAGRASVLNVENHGRMAQDQMHGDGIEYAIKALIELANTDVEKELEVDRLGEGDEE